MIEMETVNKEVIEEKLDKAEALSEDQRQAAIAAKQKQIKKIGRIAMCIVILICLATFGMTILAGRKLMERESTESQEASLVETYENTYIPYEYSI